MIKIIQDSSIKDKVNFKDIHGMFPYKKYLEMIGLCQFGKYIVIVSDKPIEDDCTTVYIKNENMVQNGVGALLNKKFLQYRAKETDIFTVNDSKIFVFKPMKQDD